MGKTTNNTAATFQIKSAFQLAGKQFFLLGDILFGEIKKGMVADLSSIGIVKSPIIDAIEFSLHRDGDKAWEYVGLGISNLTESEKDFLRLQSPFPTPILIEEKNAR